MEFSAKKSELIAALKRIAPAFKHTNKDLRVLDQCMISCIEGKVELLATNIFFRYVGGKHFYTISTRLPDADIKEEGVVLVDFKLLKTIVMGCKKLYSAINFKTDDFKTVTVSAEGLSQKMTRGDLSEYPEHLSTEEKENDNSSVDLPAEDFITAFVSTNAAISKDTTKIDFCGSAISFLDKKFNVVTTDGHRLHVYSKQFDTDGEIKESVLPSEISEAITQIIDNSGLVHLTKCKDDIAIIDDGVTKICSCTIKEKFPDFTSVIPSRMDFCYAIDRDKLRDTLKTFVSASKQNNDKTFLTRFGFDKDNLEISNKKELNAKVDVDSECCSCGCYRLAFGINCTYVLDAVNAIPSDTICLFAIDSDSPILITGCDESSIKCVVMPMQL